MTALPVFTRLGKLYDLVLPLDIGIHLGLNISKADSRITASLQNDAMTEWLFVTCFLGEALIHSWNGSDHSLWLGSFNVKLSKEHAEAVHGLLQCDRDDHEDRA